MSELTLELAGQDEARLLFGPHDQNLRAVRDRFGVEIISRNLQLLVKGKQEDTAPAVALLGKLIQRARGGDELLLESVEALLDEARPARPASAPAVAPQQQGDPTAIEGVRLRTDGQRHYVRLILESDIVFAVGPAGTGKTFLAVLLAVNALKQGLVQRIILCRPAVEAGEKLGYLPGDFQAKVNPYMRPLYDALHSLLDFDTVKRYLEREVIEIAPLAYMRGRTLNDAFIILDEAQNTTRAQMKMFLTRMGEHAKIVVTGDISQIDLPPGVTSGLVHAQSILKGVPGITFMDFTVQDIVRHPVVWRVIEAYDGKAPRRKRGRSS